MITRNRRISTLAAAALCLVTVFGGAALPALAQDSARMQFDPGATSATINGTIVGDEFRDYVLSAQAGQTMVVSLGVTATNGNGSAFFNIVPAGQDFPALYNGSADPDRRAEVTLPESGDWAIRVYLVGNDADTGRTVGYSIDVDIAPAGGSQDTGSAGGGSTVRVTGVAANDVLNVRSGPGIGNPVVGALASGDSVRMLRCQDVGASRWCEIEMMTDMRERGWVNARYLQ